MFQTAYFLLLPRYTTLSIQFTACLRLTKKPALNCKDKGTDLISYCYASRECKTLVLLESNWLALQRLLKFLEWAVSRALVWIYTHTSVWLESREMSQKLTWKCISEKLCMCGCVYLCVSAVLVHMKDKFIRDIWQTVWAAAAPQKQRSQHRD